MMHRTLSKYVRNVILDVKNVQRVLINVVHVKLAIIYMNKIVLQLVRKDIIQKPIQENVHFATALA